ncbi:hypothetical protein BDF20DRAFT_823015 [Mycotypha africana]|uniref:uncharacterized protein n=1 Tax=Mycotypha africana TaxID=64632 RepID=UPI002301C243|nr:uncharacterized protein BDF20DRAFT_823015 [Mycotypha africana]KAI8975102.1 hypothetical protein BDF20DRAFT_823015 [Mycotypha africana]
MDSDDGRTVKIGTRVSLGHRNYKLMYDMLTGIRISVGRVSAKMPKELVAMDFLEEHKMGFDIMGNELTPGVRYDFKFKDYAPWVFRLLREKFRIDAADYLMTLTEKYILSEINSPGKSGSFFYYSRDYRFIIKTIHHTEHKTIRRVLKDYYEHVSANPDTLLCRYYGLHRIKLPHGRKIHFVVMGNVLPNDKVVHETYDLKGSTFGRLTPDEIANQSGAILKDLNWVLNGKKLELGPQKRNLLMEQLRKDVDLLVRLQVMDYSLLVGIYDFSKGYTGPSHLKIVSPQANELQKTVSIRGRRESKAEILRQAINSASPVQLDPAELPELPSEERKYCKFYAEDGGFRSTDTDNKPTDKLYYFGIIDILTPYNYVKKSEHLLKSFTQNKTTISAVEPEEYGRRFLEFMETVVIPIPAARAKIELQTI